MVNPNGEWRWDCIQHLLPQAALLTVAAIKPSFTDIMVDYVGWRGEEHRNFTVKSTYVICSNRLGNLLTNGERNRRHLTNDSSCSIYGAALEEVSHVLRGCVESRSLWPRLVKDDKLNKFLRMEVKQCLGANARWTVPPRHWIKVNTDGARNTNSGLATCGGMWRDFKDKWCFGFSRALGLCSALEVKLWESGIFFAVGLMDMKQRCWDVQFLFIRREGNFPADTMTRFTRQGTSDYLRFMESQVDV
ncbi:hypothetical protein V6N11_083455 [Hibiscus sabdariffa]|uniref:RNase H type-1 domain-containing protein n=1 Tax=Hibiscus sabdariffa TaxID=183260 RepID=A0ABR2QLY5_9ROSI